jgi:enoyl-CoA hydratase/carnithine racemase
VSEHLRIEQHGPVRVLTIERPEYKNALHGPLRTALRAAMGAANVAEPLGRRCVRVRVMRIVGWPPYCLL